MLSKKAIEEFKEIYQNEYGKQLPDAEAMEMATNLLNLMRTIYKPIPKTYAKNQ